MQNILSESELIDLLKNSKNVLLLEPNYKRRYLPLGLAKISSFVKENGGNTYYSRSLYPKKVDLICVSTIFTTDLNLVIKQINECKNSLFLRNTPIIVGGIAATLMPDYIIDKTKSYIFKGCSKILDNKIPNHSIDYQVSLKWVENSFNVFTTRGCPNKCGYCVVSKIEPDHYINESWQRQIEFCDKKICIIGDNNLLSFPIEHLKNVVKVLNDNNKQVIIDSGIDCRLVNEDNAKLLTSLKYTRQGFRTAFDRMSDDGYYQRTMELLLNKGLKSNRFYTYILFNFNDTPQEALYRAKEAWKFGSRPYPQQYRPLDQIKKVDFIGKHWTKKLVKAFREYVYFFGYAKNDRSFEQWMKNNSKYKLDNNDWDKFYFKKEKTK